MKLALLVIGNGRLDYLHRAVDSALEHLPVFDHYLMIDDSGSIPVQVELTRTYPDFEVWSHSENLGMARAVQSGFDLVLRTDADYVFWLEEDFRILKPPPISAAITVLQWLPEIAQMLFQRQCLTPEEHAAGSVAGAMNGRHEYGEHFITQEHIFSLNPCLIPRRILQNGWPEGPLGIGNEAGFTKKLLDAGFTFGVWTEGGQYVEHLGWERGAKWQL